MMRPWTWRYEDKSNPAIPSRHTEWAFTIPFILAVEGGAGWDCYFLSAQFLVFGFELHWGLHCGRGIRYRLQQWGVSVSASNDWMVSIFLGISRATVTTWRIHGSIRKMTPEARAEFRGMLKAIVDGAKP